MTFLAGGLGFVCSGGSGAAWLKRGSSSEAKASAPSADEPPPRNWRRFQHNGQFFSVFITSYSIASRDLFQIQDHIGQGCGRRELGPRKTFVGWRLADFERFGGPLGIVLKFSAV